jgi:microcompartment protein CcmK/EutM
MTLILHKRSNTHLKVPLVSDLSSGELSINTYDGRLFIKKTVSSVDSIVTISNDYADLINTPTFSTNYGVTVTTVGTVITIGTPQDLQTTASPTFAGATINGDLTIVNNANTWTFNSDGEIQLPSGGDIVDSSGASVLGGGGGGGGGLSPTPIKTSAYTAVANDLVRCNSTASSFSVTLPLNPPDGAIIGITDVDSKFAEHPVTLLPNTGKTIENNTGVILDISGTYISVVYVLADLNWKILETPIIHNDGALNSTAIISNNYVASGNDLVRCDSSAASFSITFPSAPVDGSIIGIVDSTNSFSTHNVTLIPGSGKTIDGSSSYVLSTNGVYVSFIYIEATSTWRSLGESGAELAANNVLLGNGTSALQVVAPGTTGNVLTSDGTTWSSQPAPISLPSQTGNATKYLTTDGTTASWGTISKTVEVLKRDGTTSSSVLLTTGYLAVLNRSSTTIQVSIT